MKLNDENQQKIISQMEQAFDKLDDQIDPNFVYVDPATKKTKSSKEGVTKQ